jgi:homocysteine S-methyltransferase
MIGARPRRASVWLPMGPLRALLSGPGPAILDGALATELEAQGHDLSDRLWSARLLADDPDAIVAVHRAYRAAGAQVLTTAGYQASAEGFAARGLSADDAEALLRRSVELARGAADGALVAASCGPFGAMLAGGQEYTGDYGAARARDVEDFHERRLRAVLAAAPDCVACETIPRASEAAALCRVLDRLGAPEAWIAFSCRDGRTTSHGEPIEDAVAAASASERVVAVGVNCTAPEHIGELLARARTATDRALVAYPNSGRTWDGNVRRWTAPGAAALPADAVRAWAAAGARLIGGCCGIGPAAVRAIAGALRSGS